jgi:hypothetical protein
MGGDIFQGRLEAKVLKYLENTQNAATKAFDSAVNVLCGLISIYTKVI